MTYIQPLLLVFIGVALGGLLLLQPSKGRRVALLGMLGLSLLSWPPVNWLLSRPLEARYAVRPFHPPPGLQAVVVLDSSAEPPQFERPYPVPDRDAFRRCEHAVWIYERWGPIPVLACEAQNESDIMRDLLVRAGVAKNMIWTAERSRSTHENAVFGARVLRLHGVERVALVVDAASMPRAAACFRKEGLEVVSAPSEFRTWGSFQGEAFPGWTAIRRNEIILHETLGLVWYHFRGWI